MSYFETPPQLPLPPDYERVSGTWWRPNAAFVSELAQYLQGKRVLEIFAGNGYLAALLQREGVEVRPTTLFTGHDGHQSGLYTAVEELDAESAVLRYGPESDVLLMAWPTVTEAALRAALLWGPARDIVFVGEITDYSQNHLGGCATDAFFECMTFGHRFASYQGNWIESARVGRISASAYL